MHRIYVASSWRNPHYPLVVQALREAGHEVYDFRNPPHGGVGFHWTDVDPLCQQWNVQQFQAGLQHPAAKKQFQADLQALQWADTCVLVLPSGRSAHTEAGYMAGAGKRTIAFIPQLDEPELMYSLFHAVVSSIPQLLSSLQD